eukprot:g3959.t1
MTRRRHCPKTGDCCDGGCDDSGSGSDDDSGSGSDDDSGSGSDDDSGSGSDDDSGDGGDGAIVAIIIGSVVVILATISACVCLNAKKKSGIYRAGVTPVSAPAPPAGPVQGPVGPVVVAASTIAAPADPVASAPVSFDPNTGQPIISRQETFSAFCGKCGAKNASGGKFCISCGNNLA